MENTEQQILPNGSRIGVYEIERTEVSSDFSIVYLGLNHHLNAKVYLEEYFPRQYAKRAHAHAVEPRSNESRDDFDAGLSIFIEQSESLLNIAHPNIVAVENIIEANGTAYLVTRYLKELPLAKLCINRETQFDEDQVRVIFLPILSALQQVHELGSIHGAATPENILLKKDAEPVLVNFATARLALATRTDALSDCLSAGYAPPEYGGSSGKLGPWSDIYTLGATMYHCVSGRAPDPARNRIAALSRNYPDPYQPLTRTPSAEYTEVLRATIDSMLALKIPDRPQSANAVLAMLEQAPEASPADAPRALGAIPAPSATDKGKNKRLIIVSGTGLAAALLIIGFWFQKPEERRADSSALEDLKPADVAKQQGQTALKPESRESDERYEKSTNERLALVNPEVQTRYPSAEISQSASHKTTGAVLKQDSSPLKAQQKSENAAGDTPGSAPIDDSEIPEGTSIEHIPVTESVRANPTGAEVARSEDKAMSTAETGYASASSDNAKNAGDNPVGDLASAQGTVFTAKKETATTQSVSIEASTTQTTDAATSISGADHARIISEHIAAAEKHLDAERLTTPSEGNALMHYRAILAIAPDHPDGRAGLEKIVWHYGRLIEKAVDEERFQRARIYLKRAGSVLPNAPAVQDFQTKIEDAEAVGNRK